MSILEKKIEDYLLGRLSDQDLAEFKSQLKSDPSLQLEVEQTKAIHDSLELEVEMDLRQDLAIMASQENTPAVVKSIWSTKWALVAVIAALVGASFWMFSTKRPAWDKFASDAYVGYDFEGLRAVDQSIFSGILEEAREGKYGSAIEGLESYLDQHPQDYEARFLRAHLYREQGNQTQARNSYKQLAQSESILWAPRASWNYLLLSIPDQWDDTAKEMAAKIKAERNHPYHDKLPQLLKYVE